MKTPAEALKVLRAAFSRDDDYADAWHDNIACAAMDEGADPEAAQRIARRVMGKAFDVTTRHPRDRS